MRTVSGPTDHVVVVGAGLAGLSATLRLLGAGRAVTVLERDAEPGGRCGVYRESGYTFDTGPVVLTLPEVLDETFAAVGERTGDWVRLTRLDPAYRAYFPDGSHLDVRASRAGTAAEIERVCGPAEAAGFERFADFGERLYRAEWASFIDRNIDSPLGLLVPDLARLAALGGFRRLAPTIGHYFGDPRTRRLFSFQALYAGLSPYRALGLYAVISYLDCVRGVYTPAGGMHAIPRALAGAAAAHGARLRYDAHVSALEIRAGRARAAILASGERVPGDAFVLTADVPVAYRELLGSIDVPRNVRRLTASPSCVVLHVGARARYRGVGHHTIHFGRAWRSTFTELIERRTIPADPSLLVTNPTRSDPSLAPAGAEVYYVLLPVPNLDGGQDWDALAPRFTAELLDRLEALGYHGLTGALEVAKLVTPADFRRAGLDRGTPFAAAHTFTQTGPFRPANLVAGLDNVVLAGSGTVPGVGVPMVGVSGRLAAERVCGPRP